MLFSKPQFMTALGIAEKNWRPKSIKGGILQNFFGTGYSREIKNTKDLDNWYREQKSKGTKELKEIKHERNFWFTEMLKRNADNVRSRISSWFYE